MRRPSSTVVWAVVIVAMVLVLGLLGGARCDVRPIRVEVGAPPVVDGDVLPEVSSATSTTTPPTTTTTTAPPPPPTTARPAKARSSRSAAAPAGSFVATCYSLTGATASGTPAGPGSIAVDPRVIPLGTRLRVSGYGEGVAVDTGRLIKGRRIDVWKASGCMAWGRRTVTVEVLG